MKSKRPIFLCVLVVALVIGVFSIKREQGKPQRGKESGAAAVLSSEIIRVAKPIKEQDQESLAAKTHSPRVLDQKAFCSKFGLTQITYVKMTGSIARIYRHLNEENGLAATVDAFDGKELKMSIPGTKISADELTNLLMARLGGKIRIGNSPDDNC